MGRRDFSTPTNLTLVNVVTNQPATMSSKVFFGERIRMFRKRAGYLQPALAEALGVTKNAISNWEAGRSRPDPDNIMQMCRILHVTPSQLFGVEDAITEADREHIRKYHRLSGMNREVLDTLLDKLLSVQKISEMERPNLIAIPREVKPLAAGTGDPSEVYEESEMVYVHAEAIRRHVDYVFNVNGDSMTPSFRNGEMVLVQTASPANMKYGDIGAFQIDNELYIKEYREDGLYSHNPNFSPMLFKDFENVYLIGKVIGSLEETSLASDEEIALYESFASSGRDGGQL